MNESDFSIGRTTIATQLTEMLRLRNPLVLGSGPLTRNAAGMAKYAGGMTKDAAGMTKDAAGAGGIVAKSATLRSQAGNPAPRVALIGDNALLNWEDLPNPGYVAMAGEIARAKELSGDCPIIASIGPLESEEHQADIASAFEAAGADAIELDFKWGARVHGDLISRITARVKRSVSISVIAKLAPFQGDIVETARAVEAAGADAITAINSVYPAMRIDVRKRTAVLSAGHGGLSGAPILPIAVSAVYRIYEAVRIPIFGSGGVMSGEDALQMIMAGAQALQICTAVIREGVGAFSRINGELEELLDRLEIGSIEEAVGAAHRIGLYVPDSETAGAAASPDDFGSEGSAENAIWGRLFEQ